MEPLQAGPKSSEVQSVVKKEREVREQLRGLREQVKRESWSQPTRGSRHRAIWYWKRGNRIRHPRGLLNQPCDARRSLIPQPRSTAGQGEVEEGSGPPPP